MLTGLAASVRALSPAAVLERGYAVLQTDEGQVVRSPRTPRPVSGCGPGWRAGSIVVEVVDDEDDDDEQFGDGDG